MSGVRSRIAAFEKENDAIAAISSPVATSAGVPEVQNRNIFREESPVRTEAATSSTTAYNRKVRQSSPSSRKSAMLSKPKSTKVDQSASHISPGLSRKMVMEDVAVEGPPLPEDTFTTNKDNQNRRSRKEIEANMDHQNTVPIAKHGSLKQQRNMLQYKKQRARERSKQTGAAKPKTSHNRPASHSSNRRSGPSMSNESSDKHLHAQLSTDGDSSVRPSSASVAKLHRMQRMRQGMNRPEESSPERLSQHATQKSPHRPRTPNLQVPSDDSTHFNSVHTRSPNRDDSTQFNSVHTRSPKWDQADDDATLTSVRQIMRGNNPNDRATDDSITSAQSRPFRKESYGSAPRTWVEDEKFSKQKKTSRNTAHLRNASSSEYESDGAGDERVDRFRNSDTIIQSMPRNDMQGTGNAMEAFMSKTRSYRVEEDDRTFDYGELNENNSEASFDMTRKAAEKEAGQSKKMMKSAGFVKDEPLSGLVNNDDLAYYTKHLEDPLTKTCVGVVAVAAVGGLVMGPVGLLVGAAAVGIGIGAMQVPEEQRENVREKTTNAIMEASDKMSSSCITVCQQSGCNDNLPSELATCYAQPDTNDINSVASSRGTGGKNTKEKGSTSQNGAENQTIDKVPSSTTLVNTAMRGLMPDGHGSNSVSPRKALCLRDVRIIPVSQIHGLQPSQQSRAWLDVMASAHTSMDEKNEAMEEIRILAKDKTHAAVLLQDGILDSLMWILSRHLEKLSRKEKISTIGVTSAKLAASTCVTLGKAHCALVHTGGDLLLMSMYEHGNVPEERQLAQMLYEIPHHHPVDSGNPSSTDQVQFKIKTMSMHDAQELAKSIRELISSEW